MQHQIFFLNFNSLYLNYLKFITPKIWVLQCPRLWVAWKTDGINESLLMMLVIMINDDVYLFMIQLWLIGA
jgi:hypothetical protein